MYLDSGGASQCSGVRRFYFPQTIYIIVGIVSALVVIINSLAMISVLRNYRRLRQRIYVFIISQAAAEILAGLIFFADVMALFFLHHQDPENNVNDDLIYTSSFDQGKKLIRMKASPGGFSLREILEGCKSAAMMLSVMNVILVTFALYKRTTSMGRHRENLKGLNGGASMDGSSFLPAFDTMLRVLSMDSYTDPRGCKKKDSQSARDRDPRSISRQPPSSKLPDSQQINRAGDSDFSTREEELPDGEQVGIRPSTNVVRFSENDKVRNVSIREQLETPKHKASITRLLSSGKRVSQVFRSRSPSTVQEYVGRHGNSVMSKRATGCSLVSIWLIFLIMCFVPFALRRSREKSFTCPEMCRTVEVMELNKIYDSMMNSDEGVNDSVSNRIPRPEPMKELMTKASLSQAAGDDVMYASGRLDVQESNEWKRLKRNEKNKTLDEEYPGPEKDGKVYPELITRPENGNSATTVDKLRFSLEFCVPNSVFGDSENSSNRSRKPNTEGVVHAEQTTCDACSSMYFPHNKSYMLFNASVIVVTWVWMIMSAGRLLYLRKHSSNVFVRCSALWRFMFMAAAFYFITLAPYVASIVLDFFTPSLASESPLWYSEPPQVTSNFSSTVSGNRVVNDNNESGGTLFELSSAGSGTNSDSFEYSSNLTDVKYLNQLFGAVATFLILFNLAISPSIYLIRLLGLRRIISAL